MYIAKSILFHDGKEYRPGQEVPLTDTNAKPLLEDRAVALVGSTAADDAAKKSQASGEVKALRKKLTASEKEAAKEKALREALEVRIAELESQLALAGEMGAAATEALSAQNIVPTQPAQARG